MTPFQAVKFLVLLRAAEQGSVVLDLKMTGEKVDELYEELTNKDGHWDIEHDLRHGEVETDIEPPFSRNYEPSSVAAQLPCGKWVGWTYWHGGGKHSNPEEIEWMEDAYFLDCKETEKTVIVREFTKIEGGEL